MSRLKFSARAAAFHFIVSLTIAVLAYFFIFLVWYPGAYSELSGGRELFVLLVSVDVVCGPLLTLVVFSPEKSRSHLVRDLVSIILIQLGALGYGLHAIYQARPIVLAFEGNRFRVVSLSDVPDDRLGEANKYTRLGGPKLMGVKLAVPGDADYLESIQMSLAGLNPALRPERWVSYDSQRSQVIKAAAPVARLMSRYPESKRKLISMIEAEKLNSQEVGYLPLSSYRYDTWVVLVSLKDANPLGFLPLNGWF